MESTCNVHIVADGDTDIHQHILSSTFPGVFFEIARKDNDVKEAVKEDAEKVTEGWVLDRAEPVATNSARQQHYRES